VIHNEQGWFIDINDKDWKRLKNKSSKRLIPVHETLVQIGFLDYVEVQRARGEARLFPSLKADQFGRLTTNYSKVFGRWLRKMGFSKHYVFHSFRHLFVDLCTNTGLPPRVERALVGHSRGDVHERYGKGYWNQTLMQEIQRLPFVDLSHLCPRSNQGMPPVAPTGAASSWLSTSTCRRP